MKTDLNNIIDQENIFSLTRKLSKDIFCSERTPIENFTTVLIKNASAKSLKGRISKPYVGQLQYLFIRPFVFVLKI